MTPSNGTYQQPGRGHACRTLKRDNAGRFIAKGAERRPSGKVSAQTLKEKAVELFEVMLTLTKKAPSVALRSRAFPLPIYRAVMYDKLYNEGFSTVRIGQQFGKNHATVLHSIRQLHILQDVGDRAVLEVCQNFEIELQKPKTKTNENMGKLYFTTISFAGGLRKVEKELWPTMADTFRNAIVEEEQLEILKANLEESVKTRAEELKVKPVPVVLSPEFNKLKGASLPRFLSVGRITVTFTEVRHIIGKDTKETDA